MLITAAVIKFRARKYLLVGWMWFLGTLVPVIGLVQVGDQAMADRYAYIPLIGIFLIVVWSFADLSTSKNLSGGSSVIVIGLLSAATYRQIGYWSNNYDLWAHTLSVTQNNFIAHDNLGGALLQLSRPDEAFAEFQAASQINPRDPMSHTNMGAYFQEHGRLSEAVQQYKTAISLTSDPGLLASTYANLGTVYRESGSSAQARESYERSLQLNPGQFNAYLGLGRLLEKEAKYQEAASDFQRSAELRPTADAYLGLGRVLEAVGKVQESKTAFEKAAQLAPDSPDVKQAVEKLGRR